MKLVEAIKTLKPGERLKALVFLVLVSSFTGLATVWLKGNPCKDIGDQYTQMLKNYSEIAKSNNALMEESHQRLDVIMTLRGILEKIDSSKSDVVVKDVILEAKAIPNSHKNSIRSNLDKLNLVVKDPDSSDSLSAESYSRDTIALQIVPIESDPDIIKVRVKRQTKSIKLSREQEILIDSALKITSKFTNVN